MKRSTHTVDVLTRPMVRSLIMYVQRNRVRPRRCHHCGTRYYLLVRKAEQARKELRGRCDQCGCRLTMRRRRGGWL
jgi:predicted SprT family Zn-dependent metalloprotease